MSDTSRIDNMRAAITALQAPGDGLTNPFEIIMNFDLCGQDNVDFDKEMRTKLDAAWKKASGKHREGHMQNLWNDEQLVFADNVFYAYTEAFHSLFLMKENIENERNNINDIPQAFQESYEELLGEAGTLRAKIGKLMTSSITRNAVTQILDEGLGERRFDNEKALKFLGDIIRYSIDSFEQVTGYKPPVYPGKQERAAPSSRVINIQRAPFEARDELEEHMRRT